MLLIFGIVLQAYSDSSFRFATHTCAVARHYLTLAAYSDKARNEAASLRALRSTFSVSGLTISRASAINCRSFADILIFVTPHTTKTPCSMFIVPPNWECI